MSRDHALFAGHGLAATLALAAALAWPRAGDPALLVPLGPAGLSGALAWADTERADYLAIESGGTRIIARVPSEPSLWRALASGILPVAVRNPGCREVRNGRTGQWKN